MRIFFFILLGFFVSSCETTKKVYWCGDHPCINKAEKEAYFKKTMIVEIKKLSEIKKNKSNIDKVLKQAEINEKKRLKDEKEQMNQVDEIKSGSTEKIVLS